MEESVISQGFKNGKLDANSEDDIFLHYSTRSKAYKCLNTNTNKIMESENVNFDEYIEVHEEKSIKEPKVYKSFVYFYEGIPIEEEVVNQLGNQQKVLVTSKSHPMNVKLHLGTELHSRTELNSNYEL